MRKENSDYKTRFVTEAGTYLHNKDYFAFVELDDMACYVIADGLDNDLEAHSAEMAVRIILENFLEKPTMSKHKLKEYIDEAHEWLKYESRRVRLKTSLLVVVSDYTRIVWAGAGNARLYLFRHGRLAMRSQDQSLSQSLSLQQPMSDEAMDRHEERHNLLQYVGKPEGFTPYLSDKIPLSDGDVMILCTPGAWESIHVTEMLDAMEDAKEPELLTDTLEEVLLSKQKRSVENYTIAAIFANKVYKEEKRNYWKLAMKIALIAIPLLLAGGGFWFYKAREAARMAEYVQSVVEHEQNGDMFVADDDYEKALKEYSEARNASVKVKNKIHTALLTKKQRISQLIVDGDAFFKEGNFEKAVTTYKKAKEEAKNRSDYDMKELDERIEQAEERVSILALIKQADLQLQGGDYKQATEQLQRARIAAIEAGYEDGEKQIRAKLAEAETKMSAILKEQRQLEADRLEQRGDRSYAAEDFTGAIESFQLAQEIYQEIGMLERVLGMERKIAKADEKLNPIPTAPPQHDAAAGTGSGVNGSGNGGTGTTAALVDTAPSSAASTQSEEQASGTEEPSS